MDQSDGTTVCLTIQKSEEQRHNQDDTLGYNCGQQQRRPARKQVKVKYGFPSQLCALDRFIPYDAHSNLVQVAWNRVCCST